MLPYHGRGPALAFLAVYLTHIPYMACDSQLMFHTCSVRRVENPLETDPIIPHLITHYSSFHQKNKMQADEMKNRSSLHSI